MRSAFWFLVWNKHMDLAVESAIDIVRAVFTEDRSWMIYAYLNLFEASQMFIYCFGVGFIIEKLWVWAFPDLCSSLYRHTPWPLQTLLPRSFKCASPF